ncbi:M43 family zinc metalloprotease [Dyadobacter chenwenxiniae]|uniref:T9SS type A sorting domain-containing protein n=1 Tax=Dyadobacter chenwenxiniae TaxID=2906456 RepID=A0A9X1PNZ0_9BACT|nr:M43 family zinc metalloprotease [Dyadobacter chenwenxiniae]MCF0063033.1 T9SS type A sorting domain-containing protein [Dyadobacter chenwenxiniae]UON84794.1 M43 family zinc metalloprotease [Dyadobacter chenwenxiniae]
MTNLSSKLLLILLLIVISKTFVLAQGSNLPLNRCASDELNALMISKHPALQSLRMKSEEAIQTRIKANRASLRKNADETITIPVVVHVVHSKDDNTMGGQGNANITDAQIQSQIDVLNEDYGNASGYKGYYTDSLGVDTGIRFKLVNIVRTFNDKEQFSPITDADELAGISPAWLTNRYLNIWVCRLSDRYLGTSQFPVVTELTDLTAGLSTAEDEALRSLTDGVIIDFRYFGRNSPAITSSVYNLGRTTTHEVGHWLGLIHIWGDRNCGTDHCNDTPTAFTKNETTDISCTPVFSECRGTMTRNMIENYMDYSPDVCMSVFTNDQKERMHAVLELSPRRAKLVEFSKISGEDLLVDLYPNPVSETLTANVFTPNFQLYTVEVFNQRGQRMVSGATNLNYLQVDKFPSGLYYYKVSSGGQTVTKRFVVR